MENDSSWSFQRRGVGVHVQRGASDVRVRWRLGRLVGDIVGLGPGSGRAALAAFGGVRLTFDIVASVGLERRGRVKLELRRWGVRRGDRVDQCVVRLERDRPRDGRGSDDIPG